VRHHQTVVRRRQVQERRRTTLGAERFDALGGSVGLSDRSSHFRLDVDTVVGSNGFTLYSLLRATTVAEGPSRVRVMSRQFAE
jgi:hypothetical protein